MLGVEEGVVFFIRQLESIRACQQKVSSATAVVAVRGVSYVGASAVLRGACSLL